ncbi:hypothetical protein MNBD_CHLOROFLEXI01-2600 [hydrothermal vent metagenome]|uniref:bAvd-like domain-containing protein n=1 Tax=hydrothermal vent metagenome TaxID=652676 RepID=A0A3B0WG99_9ZZZZ
MSESPIFAKLYDLLRWLLPATTKYSREYRFSLALPTQENAFSLQKHLVAAAKLHNSRDRAVHLQQADIELTLLRYKVRLARTATTTRTTGTTMSGSGLPNLSLKGLPEM